MFEGTVSQKSRSPIGGLKELESVSSPVCNFHLVFDWHIFLWKVVPS